MRVLKIGVIVVFVLIYANRLTAQSHWLPLGAGITGGNLSVRSLTVYHNELIIGGAFQVSDGNNFNSVAAWNGSTLHDIGGGVLNDPTYGLSLVDALAVYNDELHVGGYFFDYPSSKYWSRWDSNNWHKGLAHGHIGSGSPVYTFGHYQNKLVASSRGYVGALVDTVYHECLHIGLIEDTTLICIGDVNGLPNIPHYERVGVYATAEYQGDLYIGGVFDTISGARVWNIAKWNGAQWSTLGTGLQLSLSNDRSWIWSMTEYNNELYVAGNFDRADTMVCNGLARWDGTHWLTVDNMPFVRGINTLHVYNGRLWVGRASSFNESSIWSYDGTTWRDENMQNANIHAFATYNNELYVGGGFTTFNNPTTLAIAVARYSSIAVTNVDDNHLNDMRASPNPTNSCVSLNGILPQTYELVCQNLIGQTVATTINQSTIDLSHLPTGIYILSVFSAQQLVQKVKIIKQ